MKQTRIRSVRICPALYSDAFRTAQKLKYLKVEFYTFLKLRYVVFIPMLFKVVHQEMGVTVIIFKPLFLQNATLVPLSQATYHRKKAVILFLRAR